MKRVLFPTSLIVFDPINKTIEFNAVPGFDCRKVMAIINISFQQTLIYAVSSYAQNIGGTWSDSGAGFPTLLTLQFDTTAMSLTDLLQVIYDDGEIGVYDANGLPVYSSPDNLSTRNGLDVNLLNSSVMGQIGKPLDDPYGDSAIAVAFNQGGTLQSPHMDPVTNDIFTKVVSTPETPVYVNVTNSTGGGTVTQGSFPWSCSLVTTSSLPLATDYGNYGPDTLRVVLAANTPTLPVGGTVSQTVQSTTDISATYTTTGNSASFISAYASQSHQVVIGTVSGTNPVMDLVIEESNDNANWYTVYSFPRITSGSQILNTPLLTMTGYYFRYRRTISGTTPSFGTTIYRASKSGVKGALIRTFFDRTPNPNTLNSTTASYYVGGCTGIEMIVSMGAGGTGTQPHFALQFSEDNSNWYTISATDTTVNLSQTINAATNIYQPKFARAIVSTAGSSGYTLNYVCIKGYGQ